MSDKSYHKSNCYILLKSLNMEMLEEKNIFHILHLIRHVRTFMYRNYNFTTKITASECSINPPTFSWTRCNRKRRCKIALWSSSAEKLAHSSIIPAINSSILSGRPWWKIRPFNVPQNQKSNHPMTRSSGKLSFKNRLTSRWKWGGAQSCWKTMEFLFSLSFRWGSTCCCSISR